MKIEIDNTQLINDIVERVVEKLKPLISNPHDSSSDELMDVQERWLIILRLKRQWVYEKTHMGIIPYYKVGKYPRYRKSKIDEWLLEKENRNNTKRLI